MLRQEALCGIRTFDFKARSLCRWCRARFDAAPAELVRGLRIDEARRLLESTRLPLEDIAARRRSE
jgi:transcriptional regulator GlxA family with amidase domain